ncbi:MAG: hypothetical protein GF383_02215 [Candidatus Lokiarchaeota archaeon]|nr:hypothetical protein [Candidatus Lokiarchaeota archaeon]MBD3338229.1 hypothetical protein [Candidatus Lokiarchaeota archaeon]
MDEIRYNSILVPIDGSSKSFEAYDYALKICNLFGDCSITILHVINEDNIKQIHTHQGEDINALLRKYQNQAEKYFNKAFHKARSKGYEDSFIERISTTILQGEPAAEIIKFTKEKDFDLIVMCLRGKKHIAEYMIGHVTERVIRVSKIPVIVIP